MEGSIQISQEWHSFDKLNRSKGSLVTVTHSNFVKLDSDSELAQGKYNMPV